MTPPDLCISIVNHSNPHLLMGCLESIFVDEKDGPTLDVWVVDNATDGTGVNDMKQRFPRVRWLQNAHRMGFSANHNQVLRRSTARYACILNDDTVLLPGCLKALVRHLDEHPMVGMVGPRALNGDGTVQNSTYRNKTLVSEWLSSARMPRRWRERLHVGVGPAQYGNATAAVEWLLGACIVVRQETLQQVGLLDEQLSPIASVEDTDWCMRAWQAGWRVEFVPAARMIHFLGQSRSTGDSAFRLRAEQHRCTIRLFRKHHGLLAALALRGVYLSTLPWNLAATAAACLLGAVTSRQAKRNLELDLRTGLCLR